MGFIPEGAKWYLADIAQEITVEGDPRNVVHTNMLLVRADSAKEAYQPAMELGAEVELTYENPEDRKASWSYDSADSCSIKLIPSAGIGRS